MASSRRLHQRLFLPKSFPGQWPGVAKFSLLESFEKNMNEGNFRGIWEHSRNLRLNFVSELMA